MSLLFEAGTQVSLALNIDDGAEDQYPRASVFGGGALITTVDLTHVALGAYGGAWTPGSLDAYTVVYVVYSDAGHTVESSIYSREMEIWQNGEVTNARVTLVAKILRNRLELEDGNSSNWVLYDDDGVTPLLTWGVSDKSGGVISQPTRAPSRRTRGV